MFTSCFNDVARISHVKPYMHHKHTTSQAALTFFPIAFSLHHPFFIFSLYFVYDLHGKMKPVCVRLLLSSSTPWTGQVRQPSREAFLMPSVNLIEFSDFRCNYFVNVFISIAHDQFSNAYQIVLSSNKVVEFVLKISSWRAAISKGGRNGR